MNAESVVVFGFTRNLDSGAPRRLAEGERVRLTGRVENALVPGRYSADCWVRRDHQEGDMAVQGLRLLDFVVYGPDPAHGIVSVETDVAAVPERESRR